MLTLQMRPDLYIRVLPTSSPVSGPDSCTDPSTVSAVGAMPSISILARPPSYHTDARPPPAKRPKLSLTTSTVPLTFSRSTTGLRSSTPSDSPTLRNTYVNAYGAHRRSTNTTSPSTPPPTSRSARVASQSPIRPLASPYRQDAPYKTPLGLRGILRNGPLPRRHFSATSTRTPRRLFPDVRHVSYRSPLEEVVPAGRALSDVEEVSDDESSSRTTGDSKDDAEDSRITARGCRKRRRRWAWTLEDPPESAERSTPDHA